MSRVTDLVLITSISDGGGEDEHPNVDKLSAWLTENHRCAFQRVDQHAGGNKAMQCDVFLVAVNYLDADGFLAQFRAIEWDSPEAVVLIVNAEEMDPVVYRTSDREGASL
jgi:hypothetical protein